MPRCSCGLCAGGEEALEEARREVVAKKMSDSIDPEKDLFIHTLRLVGAPESVIQNQIDNLTAENFVPIPDQSEAVGDGSDSFSNV